MKQKIYEWILFSETTKGMKGISYLIASLRIFIKLRDNLVSSRIIPKIEIQQNMWHYVKRSITVNLALNLT